MVCIHKVDFDLLHLGLRFFIEKNKDMAEIKSFRSKFITSILDFGQWWETWWIGCDRGVSWVVLVGWVDMPLYGTLLLPLLNHPHQWKVKSSVLDLKVELSKLRIQSHIHNIYITCILYTYVYVVVKCVLHVRRHSYTYGQDST